MSGINLSLKNERGSSLNSSQNLQKIKEIDALYRHRIREIYAENKSKIQKQYAKLTKGSNISQRHKQYYKPTDQLTKNTQQFIKTSQKVCKSPQQDQTMQNQMLKLPHQIYKSPLLNATAQVVNNNLLTTKSVSSLSYFDIPNSKKQTNIIQNEDKSKSLLFFKDEPVKSVQRLKKQNELKQIKIKQLTNKCEYFVQKLRDFLSNQEIEVEIQKLRNFSYSNMQKIDRLFKIKTEQMFFKLKTQVQSLLEEFGIQKEELMEINQLSSDASLFNYLSRKLKSYLKSHKHKQQQSSFEMQRDRIVAQKHQQRIHFLTETNEMLRLQEGKLKQKIQDLKNQLENYIHKIKENQQTIDSQDNLIFRLKNQNQQLIDSKNKLNGMLKASQGELNQQQKLWEIREKQLKGLLNRYLLEKNGLEETIEEKKGELQEILIHQRYLENENENLSRQIIKHRERYEWLERQKISSKQELQMQIEALRQEFQTYKIQYNQFSQLQFKAQNEQLLTQVESYHRAYEKVLLEYEENRSTWTLMYEESQVAAKNKEKELKKQLDDLATEKSEELTYLNLEFDSRIKLTEEQYRKTQDILAQEMEARIRALMAERDKLQIQQTINLELENQQLKRELAGLKEYVKAKQHFISVFDHKHQEIQSNLKQQQTLKRTLSKNTTLENKIKK